MKLSIEIYYNDRALKGILDGVEFDDHTKVKKTLQPRDHPVNKHIAKYYRYVIKRELGQADTKVFDNFSEFDVDFNKVAEIFDICELEGAERFLTINNNDSEFPNVVVCSEVLELLIKWGYELNFLQYK